MHGDGNLRKPESIPQDVWDAAMVPQMTISLALDQVCPRKQHAIRQAIAAAIISERERAGGARSMRFNGNLVIGHPEIPPHVWDGSRLKPLEA